MNKLETESKIKKVLIVIMMILAFIIIAIYVYNMISIATTGVDIYVSGFYNNQVFLKKMKIIILMLYYV